jgi:hypothetical protein
VLVSPPMQCVVCRSKPADIGVLCEDCRDDLPAPVQVTPEQVVSRAGLPTPAALIDRWGRAHRLDHSAVIGRNLERSGVAVLEHSISRHHARLDLEPGGRWVISDLGSANGTFLNEHALVAETASPIATGDKIGVSGVGFYFVADATALPAPIDADPIAVETQRPGGRISMADLANKLNAPAPGAFDEDEHTNVGLPVAVIQLHEPTGGGGGLVDVDGRQVQLTATQFELVALLVKRMADEAHQPDLVRGFVRTSELIADLSWDTRDPGDNHVKQLVRRVRRALIKAEIGDLIESRHRFGYRLRAIPKAAA